MGSTLTRIPDFEGAVVRTRNDRLSVWRKGHGVDVTAVRVRLLALELQRGCAARRGRSVHAGKRFRAQRSPASQTLMVWSREPETIVFPSGEKATDMTQWLWAFVFSLLSSSVADREAGSGQFWPRDGRFEWFRTRIPHFDRLVVGTGNDRLPVWRKGHGHDPMAVGVTLLRHELQCGWEGQSESV